MEDKMKEMANEKTYCKNITSGKKTILAPMPIPLINKATTIMMQEIKKFKKLLVTFEIGKIALGKYTFLIIPEEAIIVDVL